jgi:hypothetical protein
VQARWIVPTFDVAEECPARFGLGREAAPREQIAFRFTALTTLPVKQIRIPVAKGGGADR